MAYELIVVVASGYACTIHAAQLAWPLVRVKECLEDTQRFLLEV